MKNKLAIFSLLLLTACDPSSLPPSSIAPICKALGDPVKYTTENKMSARYAAWLLGATLAERNRVGIELGCPKYKP